MSTDTTTAEVITPAPAATSEPAPAPVETKEQRALKLTKRYVLWSMGGGLIPIIGIDIAAIFAAQLKMISEMSKIYGVEFKEHRARNIITTLIGSLGIVPIGTGILFSAMKLVPGAGTLAATISLPISAGAITYATGKVFIAHFESGGTLLNFNANGMKAAYKKMFEEGKQVAAAEQKAATN